jgi:RimJ/RimL family protein N-acetyltransferase
LLFRDAEKADAAFILSLRLDQRKSQYLSATSPDIRQQEDWLNRYSAQGDQAYFIVCTSQTVPIGTVRLYDATADSFCWGSWILSDAAPATAAIESALMVYAFAVDHLGFTSAHFDVRKANQSVWSFHERMGAQRTGETSEDYFYVIGPSAIASARARYRRYLTGVEVQWR